TLVRRALVDKERGIAGLNVVMDGEAIEALAASVGGDARIALNALEAAAMSVAPGPSAGPVRAEAGERLITRAVVEEALQHRTYLYDRQGDAHYDTISAFIKSLRGSDPDASLYWLARMVEAGEDPLFIVRRMVILAAEDIGLADPQALSVAVACQQAVHFIGMPEGFLPMSECALYLALAPKSNSAMASYVRAQADVEATRNDPVPMHLRNAVTGLMRGMGYGRGYQYAHDYDSGVAPDQTYLPERLKGRKYYVPRPLGQEHEAWERYQKRSRPPE
ncbi:MAG TPA: replication-associated recombination protein A, partial [Dehalococcoidia bacterium]